MMTLYGLGGLVLVTAALWFTAWIYGRYRYAAGYQARGDEMAERRAQRRAEARVAAPPANREPFPQEWTERLADTGELRELAETGDIAALNGHVAAFFRNLDLHGWTRKRGTHAA